METKNSTTRAGIRKKVLLFLPLVAVPLLTLLFWAAGGGRGEGKITIKEKGFNLNLPNAINDEDGKLSKFNYYERAALDSAKMEEMRKKDPNYAAATIQADSTGITENTGNSVKGLSSGLNMANHDPTEEKLYRRLEQLKKAVREPTTRPEARHSESLATSATMKASADVQRLEEMMQAMQDNPEPEDVEMKQINGMLENILDIQYPQRQQEKMRKASAAARGQVFPVQAGLEEEQVSLLAEQRAATPAYFGGSVGHNRFYSLEEADTQASLQNAIQARIAETQTIVNGSTVKIKLGQDVFISGVKIPANTFVFGTASLKGERLSVKITGIRYGNSIYPVELTVYDLDGLDGLYIPGAINRDVAKASADQSMQTLGVATLDDSWSAQAAGAGIEAAKSLFSKKVKLVKVVVKAGYQVLLRDEKQKDKP